MSNVIPLASPDPVPPAPTAGLMVLECPNDCDNGFVDDGETGYRCPVCKGSAGYYVCSACKEVPEVVGGLEMCGCVRASEPTLEPIVSCETCPRQVLLSELVEGLCPDCRRTGLEVVIAEDDPYYRAWVAEQLKFGHAVGWL